MTDEVWKEIPGYPGYQASSEGRVRNRLGHVLQGTVTKKGYRQISIRQGRSQRVAFVHRLVATAFLGWRPRGHIINFLNGNKLDTRPSNLEWTTPQEAARKGFVVPIGFPGESNPNSKLTEHDVREMRALRQQGMSCRELGRRFGVTERAAHRVVTKRDWKHVE